MKPYHPDGHIVDRNGCLCGMLISPHGAGKAPKGVEASAVSLHQFKQLCASHAIQLFEIDSMLCEPSVHYTDEEIKAFRIGKRGGLPFLHGADYFASDPKFFSDFFFNGSYYAVSLSMLHSCGIGPNIHTFIAAYRPIAFQEDEIKRMRKSGLTVTRIVDNMLIVGGTADVIIRWLETARFAWNMNMQVHDNLSNIYYNTKLPFVAHKISPEMVMSLSTLYRSAGCGR